MKNIAIIVAAGSGQRLGRDIPKALVEIGGIPIVVRTAKRLSDCELISNLIVVFAPNYYEDFSRVFDKYNINADLVEGGKTRTESVLHGIAATDENCDIVAIHDGARPFVTIESLEKVIQKAEETGAATLAVPLTDTLKLVENHFIVETVDRDKFYAVQTPQVFQRDLLLSAIEKIEQGNSFSDDCALMELIGQKVSIVESNRMNIKITYPEDLIIAEAIMEKIDR